VVHRQRWGVVISVIVGGGLFLVLYEFFNLFSAIEVSHLTEEKNAHIHSKQNMLI